MNKYIAHRYGILVAALTLLSAAGTALADCVDGVRKETPAEAAFAAKAVAALAVALPKPIVNSQRQGAPFDFSQEPKFSFCRGEKEGAFSPTVVASYLYKFSNADAERMYVERKSIEKQIDELNKLPPEKEVQQKEMYAKMRAAYDAAPRRQRKDPPFTPEQQAQVDAANAEGYKLEVAAKKFAADHIASVKPQTDPLRAQADRLQTYPQEIKVIVSMNADRFPDSNPTMITFGKPNKNRSAGLRVHNALAIVEGPEGAARQAFFEAIDKNYLQGLLGQPLPEVAVSKEHAERAN